MYRLLMLMLMVCIGTEVRAQYSDKCLYDRSHPEEIFCEVYEVADNEVADYLSTADIRLSDIGMDAYQQATPETVDYKNSKYWKRFKVLTIVGGGALAVGGGTIGFFFLRKDKEPFRYMATIVILTAILGPAALLTVTSIPLLACGFWNLRKALGLKKTMNLNVGISTINTKMNLTAISNSTPALGLAVTW